MINNNPIWQKSYVNIAKMMLRRNLSFQEKMNEFSFLFHDNEKNTPLILICICVDKIGVDSLKKHLKQTCNDKVKNYIIIYENHMTTTCHKIVNDFVFQYDIELFSLQDFKFDFTKLYYYVPHEKVKDPKTILDLKQRYGSNFPIILQSDPVCKYFAFKKYDIIQVKRSDNEIAYRLVK